MRKLRKLLIRGVYDTNIEPPVVISQEDEIVKVIKLFSASSELQSIFVTDHEGKFAGVITRSNLLDWIRAQVGDYFEEDGQGPDKTISLSNIIQATTIGEMLFPGSEMAAIRLENTASDAMRKMVELDIIVLSVINDANQFLGISNCRRYWLLLWKIILEYYKEISEFMTNPKISLSDGGHILVNVGIKSHR